jgi:hypothetical protein
MSHACQTRSHWRSKRKSFFLCLCLLLKSAEWYVMSYAESQPGGSYEKPQLQDAIVELETSIGLNSSQYVVVGGASLVFRGIRRYTEDLDILIADDAQRILIGAGAYKKELPYLAVRRGDDNISLGMRVGAAAIPLSATTRLPGNGAYPLEFSRVKETSELIEFIPCLSLDEMVASKSALRREKDVSDLRLLAAHMDRRIVIPQSLHYDPLY